MDPDFKSIEGGAVPPRPACLIKPELEGSPDDLARHLLPGKRTVVMGGISLIGIEGHIVGVITICRVMQHVLTGWNVTLGHPNRPNTFRHFGADAPAPLQEIVPNTMVKLIGVTDKRMTMLDAPEEERNRVAEFVSAFLSDDGPPPEIDW